MPLKRDMSSREIIEWLTNTPRNEIEEAFPHTEGYVELVLQGYEADEIIEKILEYEAEKRAKEEIKAKWVTTCRIIEVKEDYERCVFIKDIPKEAEYNESDYIKETLKQYMEFHEGIFYATPIRRCVIER